MWWITVFCGIIATIVTSHKVFGEQETPIHPTGEYKKLYWFDYAECKDIKAKAENFVISEPTKTFVNLCDGQEDNTVKCFCRVPIKRRSVDYNTKGCKQYTPHPKRNCKAFILCGGIFSYFMTCEAGTVFNPKGNACDHPDNVKCPEKLFKPPCPLYMVEVGKFPDVNSGCHSYFECQYGVMKKKQCQDDLIFDTWTHNCNLPRNSFCGCRNETSIKPTS